MFIGGMLVNLAPLAIAPILPMSDINGLEGIVGVLIHRFDPSVHTDRYFDVHVVRPNALSFGFVFVLSHLMPITAATNLFIALFDVVALPWALYYTLKACGRDPRLAIFGVAATYHRCLWYGFLGSVAAVSMLVLQVGLMNAAFSRPRRSWRDLALSGTMLALVTAHAFLYAIGAGLFAIWALLAYRQPSHPARRWLPLLPSLVYFGPWLAHLFSGTGGSGIATLLGDLIRLRPPFLRYLSGVHEWFLNGYDGTIDEALAVVFGLTLVAFLILGVRAERPPATVHAPSLWRSRLAITAGFFVAGYFLLPMSLQRPFGWWAVHVRLLMPAILALVLLVPRRPRGLPVWTLAPLGAAAIAYGAFIAHDFRTWWMPVEIAGLREAIAQIPSGKRVHALYPSFIDEHHYSHFVMGHIVDQYLVDKGGNVTPAMSSVPAELWAGWKPVPAAPWGEHTAFSWIRYSPYWDYFLVKQPAPGNGQRYRPFPDAPPGAVDQIYEQGLWSVWKRRGS